jgi:hypothetical protein
MKERLGIYQPATIEEAIEELQEFFECDMWYSKDNEWKTEKEMCKYLAIHFKILKEQIKEIKKKEKKKK